MDEYNQLLFLFEDVEIKKAMLISLLSLYGIFIGAILNKKEHLNKKSIIYSDYFATKEKYIKIITWILFVISFPPSLYILYDNMKMALSGGYLLVYTTQLNYFKIIMGLLSNYLFISITLLLLIYKSKRVLFFGMSYYFLQIFIGNRGIPIIKVIILIWLYNRFVYRFKGRHVWFTMIAGYMTLALFQVIKTMRGFGLKEWIPKLPSAFIAAISENPALKIFNEVGTAIIPTATSVQMVNKLETYYYGKTYPYSILNAIPDVFNIFPEKIALLGNPASLIANYHGIPFGSSIVAEAVINFGGFTPLVMILMGYLIMKLSNYMYKSDSKWKVAIIATISAEIIWLPRNTTLLLISSLMHVVLMPSIMYMLLRSFRMQTDNSRAE